MPWFLHREQIQGARTIQIHSRNKKTTHKKGETSGMKGATVKTEYPQIMNQKKMCILVQILNKTLMTQLQMKILFLNRSHLMLSLKSEERE
jgi:hypothetical protein